MATATQDVRLLNRYTVIRQFKAHPSNCIVYKTLDPKTKQTFIIKLIYRPLLHPQFSHFLANEYKEALKNHNPRLIHIEKYQQIDEEGFLIYEFCEQGNLELFLKKKNFKVSLETKLYLIKELLLSYSELAKLSFFKRDLKLHNILISQGVLKLGDIENLMKSHHTLKRFMFNYMSPEEINNDMNNKISLNPQKMDMWCLGVDIFYILFGRLPFQGAKKEKVQIAREIDDKFKLMESKQFFKEIDVLKEYEIFYGLLGKMLAYEPENRANIEEILQDGLFDKIYEKPEFELVTHEEKEEEEEEEKKENKDENFFNSLFSDKESIKSYGLSKGLRRSGSMYSDSNEKLKKIEKDQKIFVKKPSIFCFGYG